VSPRVVLLALILAASSSPGVGWAAKPKDPDPFQVHPDSLKGRHGRIAVAHVVSIGISRIPVPDPNTLFEKRIGDRLAAAGFTPIPFDTVLAGWKTSAAAVGGVFDTRSGRPDTARVRAAEARLLGWLRDSLGCDLRLRYEVVEVMADYDAGHTRWDGYETDAGATGALLTLLGAGGQEGKIPALSLDVLIDDLRATPLYARRAGLQTRNRMVKNHWIPVPIENLRDETLTKRALDRALGPWVDRVTPRREPE
jgi:hypothetical protein